MMETAPTTFVLTSTAIVDDKQPNNTLTSEDVGTIVSIHDDHSNADANRMDEDVSDDDDALSSSSSIASSSVRTSESCYNAIEPHPPATSSMITMTSNVFVSSNNHCSSSSPCLTTGPMVNQETTRLVTPISPNSTGSSSSHGTTSTVSQSTTSILSNNLSSTNNTLNNNNVSTTNETTKTKSSRVPPRRSSSANGGAKKRVSWDRIHMREYALVVGDHPLCQDGLPVSLGWQYHDKPLEERPAISANSSSSSLPMIKERNRSYVFPRRLSYEERRHRLCNVSGLSIEQVKNDEIALVVRTLKESWDDVCLEGDGNINPTPISANHMHNQINMNFNMNMNNNTNTIINNNYNIIGSCSNDASNNNGLMIPLELVIPEEEQVNPAAMSDQDVDQSPSELEDPLQDVMIWEEIPGMDCDLTDFEWTESL